MTARKHTSGKKKVDPDSIPASPAEQQAVRDGEADADNNRPAGRARNAPATVPVSDVERVPAADPSLAEIVDITPENRARKGFRTVEVVATRPGQYGLKRRRVGEVFEIGVVGDGFLPSWVKKAKGEDTDPEVSRSRQVQQGSTGEEIRNDVAADAGTAVPTYLGGNQRLPQGGI